jgi:putative spermidine/putrescine transport system permease protein
MVLPFLAIIGFVYVGGLWQAALQSLGYWPMFGMEDISLGFYARLFTNDRFLSSLAYTLYIALASSTLSVVVGVLVAFAVDKSKKGDGIAYTLYKVPIIIPHIVVTILITQIFFQTGVISRIGYALGFIRDAGDFPLLIFDRGGIGIMLVYLYKQIPFVTLTVFAVLKGLNSKYIQVARNLGATDGYTVRRVTLPLLSPAILSSFLITFAFGFGAFEVPFLLRSPARLTLPILAHFDYRSPVLADRPAAMAATITISLITLLFIWLYMRILRRLNKRGLEGGFL